ncbi:unnamed protein product [Prunus armeniaca]|uniref:Uncharacterized protein n=1 Tax=Prunus armeniaca TaxID=36596 RepID=A0A6J5WTT6_PRUAR|nr:unnamed protein product [Prunus armeniaca]
MLSSKPLLTYQCRSKSKSSDRVDIIPTIPRAPRTRPSHSVSVGDSSLFVYILICSVYVLGYGNESNTSDFILNVAKGDWDLAKEYLSRNPEAIRERYLVPRMTALHLAVALEHVNVVKALVELMTGEDLEIQDADGLTAMAYATMKGITQLAKCVIEKNKKLLILPSPPDNKIPLLLAYSIGHWELARYLYSVTPLNALLQDNGRGGAEIVSESFRAKIFDNLQPCWGKIQNFIF